MIFQSPERIISKGLKDDTITVFDDDSIRDVISHIFDGVHNRREIIGAFSKIEEIQEVDFGYVKELFDSCGMSKWYFQDLDGGFKIMSVYLMRLLELNTSTDMETIVICPSHHTPTPSNKGISKGMKTILDEYKSLLKEFKEQQ